MSQPLAISATERLMRSGSSPSAPIAFEGEETQDYESQKIPGLGFRVKGLGFRAVRIGIGLWGTTRRPQ